jgi:hypothetical protein
MLLKRYRRGENQNKKKQSGEKGGKKREKQKDAHTNKNKTK